LILKLESNKEEKEEATTEEEKQEETFPPMTNTKKKQDDNERSMMMMMMMDASPASALEGPVVDPMNLSPKSPSDPVLPPQVPPTVRPLGCSTCLC